MDLLPGAQQSALVGIVVRKQVEIERLMFIYIHQ